MMGDFFNNPEVYLQGSLILAFLAAYVGGVLTSFTPCVYPVIPITIAYIGAHGSSSKGKGFVISLFYVLGMAVVYTFLGGLAALTGRLFGQIQSNPWVYLVVANICIVMGLSMLGVFMISIPVPRFLAGGGEREEKRGIIGSFFVGAVSGLIVGPCTAPILAVLLSLVATGQRIVLGMSLMFVFALGLGTLLIIIGTFAKLLAGIPKSGMWMTRINKVFGIVLLLMGEYFLIKAGFLWI
jgi:cytochrome c-type biogenesis protein